LAGDESVTHELFSYSGEFYFDQQVWGPFVTIC
jgi:hypothetical protein